MNVSNSNSWTEKSEVNWQNKTESVDSNNLPKENWSMVQMMSTTSNNDWLIKNNWVQMAEADKEQKPTMEPSQKNSSSDFGLVTNGNYLNIS